MRNRISTILLTLIIALLIIPDFSYGQRRNQIESYVYVETEHVHKTKSEGVHINDLKYNTILESAVNVQPDIVVNIGSSVELSAEVFNALEEEAFTYQWSPQTGLSDPTVANPVVQPSVSTSYTVKVISNVEEYEEVRVNVQVNEVIDPMNLSERTKVKVYPRRTNDHVQIELDESIQLQKAKIMEMNGEFIRYIGQPKNSINVGDLAQGTYQLIVETDIGFCSKLFHVIRNETTQNQALTSN